MTEDQARLMNTCRLQLEAFYKTHGKCDAEECEACAFAWSMERLIEILEGEE